MSGRVSLKPHPPQARSPVRTPNHGFIDGGNPRCRLLAVRPLQDGDAIHLLRQPGRQANRLFISGR